MVSHQGLYEVHLPTTDVDRAVDFYVEKLGFEAGFWREDRSGVFLLYTGGTTRWGLGLYHVDELVHREPAQHHLAFRWPEEEVDEMVPWLRERGIEPVHPSTAMGKGPMEEPIVHGWMPAAAVFFQDPDGNLLELIADLSQAPRPDQEATPLSKWRKLTDPP